MEDISENQSSRDNEKARLAKLYGYNIENNYEQSGTFHHVVSIAARIFNVPFAFINFVDERNILIKASIGMTDVTEIRREQGLCSLAVLQDEVTVFENMDDHPCLLADPATQKQLGIQFYAAAPIKTFDGYNLGVVAVADKKPRKFSKDEEKMLGGLAAVVMEELEERLSVNSQ